MRQTKSKASGFFNHALAAALLLVASASTGRAQTAFHETFDGEVPTWRFGRADAAVSGMEHRRDQAESHSGVASEMFRFVGGSGSELYVHHDIAPGRIIEELRPSVWVRANRGGIRILARVVFPRSIDPATGRPLTTTIMGPAYESPGQWQQLAINNVPELVERALRVQRFRRGGEVDAREAYLDQVVLNLYTGPGPTVVWIDDLEVRGAFGGEVVEERGAGAVTAVSSQREMPAASYESGPQWEIRGTRWQEYSQPAFPKVIEHRGEPLASLASLGVDAAMIAGEADGPILDEARAAKLSIIAQPRPLDELESVQTVALDQSPTFSERFEPVLAWSLGSELATDQLEETARWAAAVRRLDGRRMRPLIAAPLESHRSYARAVDTVLLGRRSAIIGDSPRASYDRESAAVRLAGPGSSHWAMVPTQEAAAAPNLSSNQPAPLPLRMGAIRRQVRLSLAAGAGGVVFTTESPLKATTPLGEVRTEIVRLLSRELEMIEPWAAASRKTTTAPCTDPRYVGAVFQTDRAWLVLPVASNEFDTATSTVRWPSFVVAGAPDSFRAFVLTPGGVHLADRSERVAGGVMATLASPDPAAALVLLRADDAKLIERLRRVTDARALETAASLRKVLAWEQQSLAPLGSDAEMGRQLALAAAALQASDGAAARGDGSTAYYQAAYAASILDAAGSAAERRAAAVLGSAAANPLASHVARLSEFWRWAGAMAAAQLGPNLLPGGELEDLSAMTEAGWDHVRRGSADIVTSAELTQQAAHGGVHGLRLLAEPARADAPPVVESPPLWIESAAATTTPGGWVRIDGWFNIPGEITGGVDGLMIYDSNAGPEAAVRRRKTSGWEPFTLYRRADADGRIRLTLALCGWGAAWVDDLTIRAIDFSPAPRPQAPLGRPTAPAGPFGAPPLALDRPGSAAR